MQWNMLMEMAGGPPADPQTDGGLPWTRADEDAAFAQGEYYDEEAQTAPIATDERFARVTHP